MNHENTFLNLTATAEDKSLLLAPKKHLNLSLKYKNLTLRFMKQAFLFFYFINL